MLGRTPESAQSKDYSLADADFAVRNTTQLSCVVRLIKAPCPKKGDEKYSETSTSDPQSQEFRNRGVYCELFYSTGSIAAEARPKIQWKKYAQKEDFNYNLSLVFPYVSQDMKYYSPHQL